MLDSGVGSCSYTVHGCFRCCFRLFVFFFLSPKCQDTLKTKLDHKYICNYNISNVPHLNASIRCDIGAAPELWLDFHVSVTEVRVTSVTSGLDGAPGIRFGSAGCPE